MRLMSDGYVRNIHVKITIPLKHLSNHWRTLEIMLINFEGNFKLKCLSKLVLPIQQIQKNLQKPIQNFTFW